MSRMPTAAQLEYMKAHIGDDRRTHIIVANVICAVAAYIGVSLRFISRHLQRAHVKAHDWFILAGLVFYTGYIIVFSLTTAYGAGRHVILVTNVKALTVTNITDECLYLATMVCIKFSLLCLYGRIFPQIWFRFHRALWATGSLVAAWFFAALFTGIFQCVPISSLWDPTVSSTYINYGKLALAAGIINIVTGFIILGIPMPLVWRIKTSRSKKWLLSITFALGGMACIVSFGRLFYLQAVGTSADVSWDDVNAGILSTVELMAGILAACIAIWRPLYTRLRRQRSPNTTEDSNLPRPLGVASGKCKGGTSDSYFMSGKILGGAKKKARVDDEDGRRLYTHPEDPLTPESESAHGPVDERW